MDGTPLPVPGTAAAARLGRLFLEGFSVMDIAEDLCSFDETTALADVVALMERRGFDLVGVRCHGLVAGYARLDELRAALALGGACAPLGAHRHDLVADDVVTADASLAETILSLEANGRCFVRVLDTLGAIATLADLEKPPVRMWLFGMVTILEMRMTAAIAQTHAEESWSAALTPGRLEAARALQTERARLGHAVPLLDCLQFGDKARILLKLGAPVRWELRGGRKAREFFNGVQRLRDDLAHAQSFVARDWPTIVELTLALLRLAGRGAPALAPAPGTAPAP